MSQIRGMRNRWVMYPDNFPHLDVPTRIQCDRCGDVLFGYNGVLVKDLTCYKCGFREVWNVSGRSWYDVMCRIYYIYTGKNFPY